MTEQQTSGRDRTDEAPQPQPEHEEPHLAEPTPGELSKRDFLAILVRAGKDSVKDRITNLSAALAYYAFLAIPSLMLVAVGVFSLVADEDAVTEINQRLEGVVPQEALTLLPDVDRKSQRPGLMMGAIYAALLTEIEHDNFQVLHQRIALTPLRKLWLAWRTWVRG